MHDDLNSFKQKSTQKFCNNLINFEKPQKLGHKICNAWLMSEKESYQRNEVILRPKREWEKYLEWERGV